MNALWNAPTSDRFSSLCARVFSPAAAILESEKTLGTRLNTIILASVVLGILTKSCFDSESRTTSGAPNENIVQNHLNTALFNVF